MLRILLALMMVTFTISANAAVMMDADWAEEICEAWNESEPLTQELGSFMGNNLSRGYKLINLERRDCIDEGSEPVQIMLKTVDGLTKCVYGGEVVNELQFDADYAMNATTKNWLKLKNAGRLKVMTAMGSGKLKFQGPTSEAMANMGPFISFLKLVGTIESETEECPL